jgi:hypothetical protein
VLTPFLRYPAYFALGLCFWFLLNLIPLAIIELRRINLLVTIDIIYYVFNFALIPTFVGVAIFVDSNDLRVMSVAIALAGTLRMFAPGV